MTSLDRAVPLAEVDAVPMRVEEELDFDVARALDETLQDQAVVTERGGRLAPSGRQRGREVVHRSNRAHALATAARRRLHEQRDADDLGGGGEGCVALVCPVIARQDGNAELPGKRPGRGLVAHRPDRRRRRTDPANAGGDHGFGEVGVLGEEAEPGMKSVAPGLDGSLNDAFHGQQVERVGPGCRWCDRPNAEAIAGPADPCCDLAAVRDEERPDRGRRGYRRRHHW